MEDVRKDKLEAMETMYEYNKKLKPAIQNALKELREERKEDTDAYLNMIMNGINWVLQVTNQVMDVLNEKEVKIVKDELNAYVSSINNAFFNKDDLKMADALEQGILPFLNTVDGITMEQVGIQEN